MPPGLDNLQHIVVLMMENRSFDHMLGSLKAVDARIDGITNQDPYGNPDTTGAMVQPQP
jgi:phospholipase C